MDYDKMLEIAERLAQTGTGNVRAAYRRENEVGKIAELLWHNPTFTLGLEYGILIAAELFGERINEDGSLPLDRGRRDNRARRVSN